MSAPVTHAEILGPDRATLVAFYGQVFGWTFQAHDEQNYTIFRTGPGGIGGGLGQTAEANSSVSVYAEVDDLDDTLARAKDLGASNTMGPIDIGGDARIGMVTDPGGNVFGLYCGPTVDEPPPGSGPAVVWFDVIGSDAASLEAFYVSLLGWEIDRGADGYAHVRPVKDGIGGGLSAPTPGLPERVILVYVASSDLEADLDKVRAAGGEIVRGRTNVGGEGLDIALFRDPAGNLTGLVQQG